MGYKTVFGVVISKVAGLLIFLILLAIANMFVDDITNEIALQSLSFINNNVGFIIIFSIVFFFAELFETFYHLADGFT